MDYLTELIKHYETMRSKSKKQQKIDNKASEKKDDDEEENSKNKLKRVFPDNIEKTEKCIQGLKTKVEKLEAKLRRKVIKN
jgi:hypothetical protein